MMNRTEDTIARDLLAHEFDNLGRHRAADLIRSHEDNSVGAAAALAAIKRVAALAMAGIGRSLSRHIAYLAIDSERSYQDAGMGNAKDGAMHSIGEHILCMEKLLDDAKRAWYRPGGNDDALNHVRKIGGVAVRCMEIHGAPKRVIDSENGCDAVYHSAAYRDGGGRTASLDKGQ